MKLKGVELKSFDCHQTFDPKPFNITLSSEIKVELVTLARAKLLIMHV